MWIHMAERFIYIPQLFIWLIFCFTKSIDMELKTNNLLWKRMAESVVYIYIYIYFSYLFFRGNKEQTMSSQIWRYMYGKDATHTHTYTVTYFTYIYFLLESVDYPLHLNMGRYWNQFWDSPMDSSQTRTWILIWPRIPILNSESGIWLCIQPTIDINSQYEFMMF